VKRARPVFFAFHRAISAKGFRQQKTPAEAGAKWEEETALAEKGVTSAMRRNSIEVYG